MTYRTLIQPDDLAAHIDDPEWVVVDCRFSLHDTQRGREDYLGSHIPGAVYAHLDDDLSGPVVPNRSGRHPLPTPAAAGETFGALGIGPGVQVVAYDDAGGAIAARLWWLLRYYGHDEVAVLDGGWRFWVQAGRPTEAGARTNARRSFEPGRRKDFVADAAVVNERRLDTSWKVLDARDERRFRGLEEPIDPVAGHIPGALSAPFLENLNDSGRFRPRGELRARFGELLGSTPPERVIAQCGSGVTACHNLLAMEHAGLEGALLYPGSWSEWITDPDRPVAREDDGD